MTAAQHYAGSRPLTTYKTNVIRLDMTFTGEGLGLLYEYRERLSSKTGRHHTLGMTLDVLLKTHDLHVPGGD